MGVIEVDCVVERVARVDEGVDCVAEEVGWVVVCSARVVASSTVVSGPTPCIQTVIGQILVICLAGFWVAGNHCLCSKREP